MMIYEGFKKRHYPHKKNWGTFSATDLTLIKDKLPADILEFLNEEGISSYSDNFLWTVNPGHFHEILSSWGLKGDKCYTFMRSAFGACIYYYNKKFFYLDPLEGRVVSLGDDPYLLLNISLVLDAILTNGFYEDYFKALKTKHDILQPDEIFAFVPALHAGGSFETSEIKVVKIKEHLLFLAQLFNNKAKHI